jgi:hypothetical protein
MLADRPDLPPSEWSIDYFIFGAEGEEKWARSMGRRSITEATVRSDCVVIPLRLDAKETFVSR